MKSIGKIISDRKEFFLLIFVYAVLAAYYLSNIITSGLQYDEAVEYFYSKYMTGTIPDISDLANMYERIVYTYQPPLYNVLMYCWLYFFDSEVLFRLAGVITTFVGSFGFYLSLRKVVDYRWANIGLALYLSAYSVMYYALECAEYNLMLGMECWMLYFFISCIKDGASARIKNIVCFYLFATLSIYSQYGAAFFIFALFVVLTFHYIRQKDMKSLRFLFLVGLIAFILFFIPLYVWFLHPQMLHQESIGVDHSFVFVKNAIYSFILSFYNNISWILTYIYAIHLSMGAVAVMLLSTFCTVILIFATFRSPSYGFKVCILAFGICFLLFFILGSCSFYAYNHFGKGLGCYNIIEGKRYALFMAPLFIISLVLAFNSIYLSASNRVKEMIYFTFVAFTFSMYIWIWGYGVVVKGNEREATYAWIKAGGYKLPTLVQEEAFDIFSFYFQHSSNYSKKGENHKITQMARLRDMTDNEMTSYLDHMDVFSHDELYFLYNNIFLPSKFNDYITHQKYNIDTVFVKGNAVVLHLNRSDIDLSKK